MNYSLLIKKILFILIIIALGLLARLWIGVYNHDEFAETHLFIKHRPIWKWTFYSLIGMSDLSRDVLKEDQRREHLLFDEFVSSMGFSK